MSRRGHGSQQAQGVRPAIEAAKTLRISVEAVEVGPLSLPGRGAESTGTSTLTSPVAISS